MVYYTKSATTNKNADIKFSAHDTFFGITFTRYIQSRKVGKPNNFQSFGSNKTQGPNQESQNLYTSSVRKTTNHNVIYNIYLLQDVFSPHDDPGFCGGGLGINFLDILPSNGLGGSKVFFDLGYWKT